MIRNWRIFDYQQCCVNIIFMEEEKNKTEKPDFTKFILPASIILAGVLISIAIIFSNEKMLSMLKKPK